MDRQSLFRDFMRYTILSVLGILGVSCYILADTFFIAKGLGTDGLAALNLAIPVFNFIYGIGVMLGMGGATRFSVCKSQGKKTETDKIFTNTLYLALLFATVFFLLGLFFSRPLALLLGADESILEMTATYLYWLLLFSPAFILNNILSCFVRNDNAPRLAMIATLTGNFSNILLDYIFIFPMQMGMFGAILATCLSPVISILILLLHRAKKKNTFHMTKSNIEISLMAQELSLGFPSLITQVSSGLVMIVFNAIILRLEGNTGVAAYGVIANISLVVMAVYNGIAQGEQPLVSSCHGRGDYRSVRTIQKYSTRAVLWSSLVCYALLYVFAQPIVSVFNSENDLRLQQIAVTGLKLYFTALPFMGYNIILTTFFTSVERTLPAHILSILKGFVVILPAVLLFSALWEMTGILLAFPITELLVALPGYVLYRKWLSGCENHSQKEKEAI